MKALLKKSAIEKKLAQLNEDLRNIERSDSYKKEIAVKRALNNLIRKHGYSKDDLITLLKSDTSRRIKSKIKKTAIKRKPRKLKIFKNPITGEMVETRGGNHKVLKAWKAEHSITNIEDWLVETKD